MEAVRANLTRFFGKRGTAVVDANLAVIQGAYDGVIDVTAAISRQSTAGNGCREAGTRPSSRAPAAPRGRLMTNLEPLARS